MAILPGVSLLRLMQKQKLERSESREDTKETTSRLSMPMNALTGSFQPTNSRQTSLQHRPAHQITVKC